MPEPVLTRAIDAVASGRDLSADEAAEVLAVIMAGDASETQIAGLLIALRTKGETVDELAGLARTMRSFATPVTTSRDDLVDTAGTGGGRSTFNVSTTAALIAAGAGCAVAKHGNRSATSRSRLGRRARGARRPHRPLARRPSGRCIDEIGFGFMFAPNHHKATRFVVPVRKELAVRTIFNFLGPLTNPAGARRQLIGVSDPGYVETMAGALALLGVERALVVTSEDALDEMSITAPTTVVEVDGTDLRTYTVRPEDVGLTTARTIPTRLAGGSPEDNAATARAIFGGEQRPAARPRGAQRRRRDLRRRPRRRPRRRRRRRPGRDRRRRGDAHARRARRAHAGARAGGARHERPRADRRRARARTCAGGARRSR